MLRLSRWADVAAVLITILLSVPSLIWFGKSWVLVYDATEYLLSGWHLVTGEGYTLTDDAPFIKRGPVLPALIGFLSILFGRDTDTLAWAVRLLVAVNPLLAYFLVKRLSGPAAGLLAAALLALFSYVSTNPDAFNVDALLVTVYLPALFALLIAVQRNSAGLALVSGLLLGLTIITKETTIASLPVAALAGLFGGLSLRGVILYYLGVAVLCLPWWVWVFAVSGEVYLVGRMPSGLRLPAVVGVLVVAGIAVALYRSGLPGRLLSDEHRRRRIGWLLSFAWVVAIFGMLLTTAPGIAEASFQTVARYITGPLAEDIAIWPLVLLATGYLVWKAVQRYPSWQLVAAAALFQVPTCLLATLESWDRRQFILLQALLLCALAAVVVEAIKIAVRRQDRLRWLAAAVSFSFAVVLLISAGTEVKSMLLGESMNPVAGAKDFGTTGMVEWAEENVPEGETILAPPGQTNYLTFLDGGQREWQPYGYDRTACRANPTDSGAGCKGNRSYSRPLPESTVWLQIGSNCETTALSSSGLLRRMDKANSEYLMMTSFSNSSELLGLAERLGDEPAFAVAHRGEMPGSEDRMVQEPLVLEKVGREVGNMPTQMRADVVPRLVRCEQSEGPGVRQRIRTKLPNGIKPTPLPGEGPAQEKAEKRAQKLIDSIYREKDVTTMPHLPVAPDHAKIF